MNIGFLGGTFDPVHNGHLRLAAAAEKAADLAKIYFVPAAAPWHKNPPQASYADRYAMVALALARKPRWLPIDIPSGEATYTVDQVAWFQHWMRDHHPRARLHLIVGADSFLTLPTWKRFRALLGMCDFIVPARGALRLENVLAILPPGSIRKSTRSLAGEVVHLSTGRTLLWLGNFASSASSTQARKTKMPPSQSSSIPAAVRHYACRAHLYGY